MNLSQILRSLFHRGDAAHAKAATRCLQTQQPQWARWHLDQLVAVAPARAGALADYCVAMGEPRLAKRYYKRALASCVAAPPPELLWHLGQQYLALVGQAEGPRAQDLQAKGMHACLRAEAAAASAYGPHGSRLHGLLDQYARQVFGTAWAAAQAAGLRHLTVQDMPDQALVCEILRELTATQTLMPFGDELVAVAQLMVIAPTEAADQEVRTLLLPLMRTFLLRAPPGREDDLVCATLGALGYIAGMPNAVEPVRALLRTFCQQNRVTSETLRPFLVAYNALPATPEAAAEATEGLLSMLEAHPEPKLADALVEIFWHRRELEAPSFRPALPLQSVLVQLPGDEGWEQSSLASAMSADNVLNLDKGLSACRALDAPSQALLSGHLSPEQRMFLNPAKTPDASAEPRVGGSESHGELVS